MSIAFTVRAAVTALFLSAAITTARHASKEPERNPRSSAPLIERALAAERAHELDAAERDLIEAARLDRQYLPAWTLANLYFRQGQADSFWTWAQRAAALKRDDLAYDDAIPLLQLADRLDPGRALAHLDDSPKLERAYLDFLIGKDRLDDAQFIARMLLARPRLDEDNRRLRAFATRLIAADRPTEAFEIWSSVGAGFGSLDHPPSGEGFDWRLPPNQGVSAVWRSTLLDVALNGREPDSCPLLEQIIPVALTSRTDRPEVVERSHNYRLHFEYSTNLAGLRWALDSLEGAPLTSSRPWRQVEWIVPIERKRQPGFSHLVLFYRRDPGTPRAEGRLQIRNVRWESS